MAWLTAMPFSLSVEPTNRCNLACPACATGGGFLRRTKGEIPFHDYSRLLDEISSRLIHLFLYFQGEPMLNSDFLKMVRLAKSKGLFVATSTNGHFLTEEMCEGIVDAKLDHIIISLDGVKASSYSRYRKNGDFERVKSGISRLVDVKKKRGSLHPLIELQFIVFQHNEEELLPFKKLAATLGADKTTIKTAQIYDVNNPQTEVRPPVNARYSRYECENGRYRLKRHRARWCWRQWSACVVTCDGSVAPCCFDKEALMSYGNIRTSDFSSCWFSERAKELRKLLLSGNRPEICKDCPE